MIRTRLLAGNAAIFAFVLAAIGAVVWMTTRSELYRAVDDDLNTRAAFLERLPHGGWPPDGFHDGRPPHGRPPPGDENMGHERRPSQAAEFFARARDLDPIEAARVELVAHMAMPRMFDRGGHRMGPPDEATFDLDAVRRGLRGWRGFTTVSVEGRRLRVLTLPLKIRGQPAGAAQFASDLGDADDSVHRLGMTLLALLPLALAATSGLGIWLTRRALKPVVEIAAAAEQIEAGNRTARLPVRGNDEFALLSARFNSMLDRIGSSFARLQEAYENQRRFVADASHELKTPLTTVKGRVGVALAGPPSAERYAGHLKAIDVAADSMSCIVADLLLLARSDEAGLPVCRERLVVSDLADAASLSACRAGDGRVETDIPGGMEVVADGALLARALSNLVANAVRHCLPPGRVVIGAAVGEGSSIRIWVEDEGEGISAEHLPRVFDRFYRVDASRDRRSGGTGLGLAIVKSIVEAHGGEVSISSTPGRGTRVTLAILGGLTIIEPVPAIRTGSIIKPSVF